jgi:S-adenosylmethionine-diacylglycerol 3-amino-3-carboxypropyl transferase
VLNLLLDRPAKIVAVDLNPAQNALLELKISAIKELEYVPYLEFLGVRPSVDRLQVYQKLRPLLSDDAQGFLDANADAVEAGVLFQGKLERYLALTAKLTRLAHPFGLGTVLKAQDLEEQRRAIDRWDSVLFRSLVQTLCRRSVLSRLSGDPGFYTSLPADLCLHKVLYNRVFDYLRQHRLRDNPLLQIVFYGRYVWEPALPIYLHAETFASVRRCLAEVKIDIVTGTMAEVLAARRGFDAFSLSDISSYLSSEECHKLFERVLRNARPGARICSRANIYHRPLAAEHARRLVRNQALERDLALHDHSCVHEFVVGSVR